MSSGIQSIRNGSLVLKTVPFAFGFVGSYVTIEDYKLYSPIELIKFTHSLCFWYDVKLDQCCPGHYG